MDKEAEFIRNLMDANQSDKAFKKLVDLYQERLYWHIRKIVITHENADDVLQNTFIRVYKGLPNFKQNSSLHTWMYRIAYNESIRYLEQNKRNQQDSLDDVNKTYLNNLESDKYFEGDEIQFKLHQVLSELTEKQRKIFQMKYYDDLKFNEIEAILGIKESTIKSSYYTIVKYIENNIHSVKLFSENQV